MQLRRDLRAVVLDLEANAMGCFIVHRANGSCYLCMHVAHFMLSTSHVSLGEEGAREGTSICEVQASCTGAVGTRWHDALHTRRLPLTLPGSRPGRSEIHYSLSSRFPLAEVQFSILAGSLHDLSTPWCLPPVHAPQRVPLGRGSRHRRTHPAGGRAGRGDAPRHSRARLHRAVRPGRPRPVCACARGAGSSGGRDSGSPQGGSVGGALCCFNCM